MSRFSTYCGAEASSCPLAGFVDGSCCPLSRSPLALIILAPSGSAVATQGHDKSISLSALDESGKPVNDLTVSALRILEDGADREVTGLMPAIDPLTIAPLADTTKGADEEVSPGRPGRHDPAGARAARERIRSA